MQMNCKRNLIFIAAILLIATIITASIIIASSAGKYEKPLDYNESTSVYEKATLTLPQSSYSYTVHRAKEITTGNIRLSETATQHITFRNIGADDFRAAVNEEITIGNQVIESTEHFSGDCSYHSVADCNFRCSVTSEAFTSRYAPLLLIDCSNYADISGIKNRDGYTLFFKSPSAPELWFKETSAEFLSAEGSMAIDNEYQIISIGYSCEYRIGQNEFTLRIETIPLAKVNNVIIPEGANNYTVITHPDAPRFLEIASAYLMSASEIHTEYDDYIYCQAFGDKRIQNIILDTTHNNQWSAQVSTTMQLSNDSKSGSLSIVKKKETFDENGYAISVNDSSPTANEQIMEADMQKYCQNILIGTVMLPKYIASMEHNEADNLLTLRFYANEDFARQLRSDAYNILYQQTDILKSREQEYTTQTAEFYLTLDTVTGLPCSSGFFYTGYYTVDALPYHLIHNAKQVYHK